MPADMKRCACSPLCPTLLAATYRCAYAYGHKPKSTPAVRQPSRHATSSESQTRTVYVAALAELRKALTISDAECERLDEAADQARKTMKANLEAKDRETDRHELLEAMIGGFEELLGVKP